MTKETAGKIKQGKWQHAKNTNVEPPVKKPGVLSNSGYVKFKMV